MREGLNTITDLSVDELDSLFHEDLSCSIGYDSCVEVAHWVSDGRCPKCQASSPGRLICSGCKASIDGGRSMSHRMCEYTGKGADFYRSFRQL